MPQFQFEVGSLIVGYYSWSLYMDILNEMNMILTELLDIEGQEITPDTYLIKDLGAESIDLLELAVAVNSRFGITVRDNDIFLHRFRQFVEKAREKGEEPVAYISIQYPFLTRDRIDEISAKAEEGPQLKVSDLIAYVTYQLKGSGK